ncbi:hypothetical protein BJI49_06930 [Acetobacter pasteurianus]|nr:hypothetical protein [Acetobacter pasteurianus]RCL07350.1 hypothetical protein BJI49_06930 [Acetobacter pasteurianus]
MLNAHLFSLKLFFKERALYGKPRKMVHIHIRTTSTIFEKRMRIFRQFSCRMAHHIKTGLCMGTVLASGGMAMNYAYAAADDAASLDALEQQIARIQTEQRELQKALVSVQKQIAQRRGTVHASNGSSTTARAVSGSHHAVASSGSGVTVAMQDGTIASTASTDPGISAPASTRSMRHAIGPDAQPVFSGKNDTPEVESVVGHRAEDMIARIADNQVGAHQRETAGAQAAGALGDHGVFHLGPLTLILGGFLDAAAVESNRHTSTGTFNYWADMPYKGDARYHTDNFEGSARYSRISLMARGNVDKNSTISGFYEMDFGAGASTTDPYESNSYTFRMRQLYMAYDNSALNFHFLAGQAWSMLTPGRVGIIPRQENLPLTIESSMLAGQTWARQLQFRFVKDFFQHRLWAGLSIENSATLYNVDSFSSVTDGQVRLPNGRIATVGYDGTGLTNDALFPNEIAPDIIGKLAWDPHWGHYEIEGILHFPHTRVSELGGGRNHTAIAGGGGGSVVLPVLPHKVEVRLAGLAGVGIGRYGSVLLPDATLNSKGEPSPIPSIQGTAGVIAHPNPLIDVYGYFGYQQAGRRYFDANGSAYGYGNPSFDNSGCNVEMATELSTLGCTGNTRSVMEATVGAWYRFFKGHYGTVEAGLQLAYSRRKAWEGLGGAPSAGMSQVFMDFRYLPFQ